MLLFKLDITKAFDSIRWDYLMALLQRLGFPVKWRDWLGALLYTSTSQVLLNGILVKESRMGEDFGRETRCLRSFLS